MDEIDYAQREEARFIAHCLAEHRQRTGSRLPAATARDCADCGQPIPAERLAVLPGARCCTDCQELREKRGVHHTG